VKHVQVANDVDSFVVISSNHELLVNIVCVVVCVVCLLWRGSCVWLFTQPPPPTLSAVLLTTLLFVVEVVRTLVRLVIR